MMFSTSLLKGQVAIITGGATGTGSRSRSAWASSARTQAAAARGKPRGRHRCSYRGTGILFAIQIDVRKPEQVEKWSAVSSGIGHIDILINNAAGNFTCHAETLSPNG